MPKEILEEQGQLQQSGSSSFSSTSQFPPRKPSPPLPPASMVQQQREQEASPPLSFRKPSSALFERETTEPSSPTVPAPSFWSAKQGIPGTKPPVPTKPLVPSTTKPSYTPSSSSSSIPTTTPSLPNRPPQTSGTAASAPSLPNRPPQTPPRPQQQQQQQPFVATKPAYLNTSYTPKKVNINIQNDTCTKCGKAVYAAELVSSFFYIKSDRV